MNIKDLLRKELMILDLTSSSKSEVINEMTDKLISENVVNDKSTFIEEIINRENLSSTGLGDGIAMPHAKTNAVTRPSVLFARSKKGIDYDALDGQSVHIFFMIAVPNGENNLHIDTLANLSKLMLKDGFINDLKNISDEDDVYKIIDRYSNIKDDNYISDLGNNITTISEKKFIVAVTACPTGIAHTYMAQEALENAAKKLGVDIKVETNGSDGTKNELTSEDIKKADGVIIAADKNVYTDRFHGKPLIKCSVTKGIKNANELINDIITNKAPIYESDNIVMENQPELKQSIGATLYKDLMNGVSHMLPFVVGGGILIALSFLFERFMGSESTLFTLLNSTGSAAFSFLIPILAGYIAYSIGDRPALMPGMVAGYLAAQGGSGFIGGLIGGFIAGEIVKLLKKLTKGMPKTLEGMKPMLIYPVLGLLITGILMYFIVVPIFTTVNNWLNDWLNNLGAINLVLLGAVLAGMMAVDMGGPINKAAYTFAIGVFTTNHNGAFAAAVMVGGMVPPLAIALATTFFKHKFTEKERQSGLTNYILGLTFITEGAIPFAASNPLLIIPSSIVGSAIAGALTQIWRIQSPAPHGGIFIIPAMSDISKGLLFLLSAIIGAIISGLLIGIFKKNKTL